jgi:RimJ/RimL family protein N-acetyltransferase
MQLGWQIKTAFRKQGYASEAAQCALDFAIADTTIDPVYAVFVKENIASERILMKLAFKYFGAGDDLLCYVLHRKH